MKSNRCSVLTIAVLMCASIGYAQKDPGVRQGPPGAGTPLNGLTPIELSMFKVTLKSG